MAFPNSNGDFMWFSYQLRPFTRNSHATPTFIMFAVSQSCSTCGTGACTDLCFNAATCNAARTKCLLRQPLMTTWWKHGEHLVTMCFDVFSVFYCSTVSQCFQLAPSFFWGCRPGCHNLWISNDFKICQVKYHHVHRLYFYCCWANTAFNNKYDNLWSYVVQHLIQRPICWRIPPGPQLQFFVADTPSPC